MIVAPAPAQGGVASSDNAPDDYANAGAARRSSLRHFSATFAAPAKTLANSSLTTTTTKFAFASVAGCARIYLFAAACCCCRCSFAAAA